MTQQLITAREIIELLRFRRLDARNGAIAGIEAAVNFCGQVADVLEQLAQLTPERPQRFVTNERWLFVCSANIVRSVTAEYVARKAGHFATSAGTRGRPHMGARMAVVPLSYWHLQWAHVIVCMEQEHLEVVREFGENLAGKTVYCWNLPDIGWNPYDQDLVKLCEDHFAQSLAEYEEWTRGHSQTS